MSFNIIKNTLETQENGVLIVENDVYRIKMRYIGNYTEDLKNHKLNTDFLTVSSKIIADFTLAHRCLNDFKRIIQQYFPTE